MNHQWTRIDTNRPEDRWTCFNHKRRPKCVCNFVPLRVHKRDPPGSAGVPPAPSLAQPRPSPPLGSNGNGAMALLRPGRCGSRRKGGCLQHCTEAQRQPKGQHAGGTPALPGKARPAVPRGSFEEKRLIVHEDEPRIDTNRPEDRWTCFNDKGYQNASAMLCSCACTNSLPGSAGVPPAQGLAQPRPSPPLGSTGNGAMALLRPGRWGSRRQGGRLQHCTEAQRQPQGQHAGGTPALPGKAAPAVPCGSFEEKRLIVNEDEPPMDTNGHE